MQLHTAVDKASRYRGIGPGFTDNVHTPAVLDEPRAKTDQEGLTATGGRPHERCVDKEDAQLSDQSETPCTPILAFTYPYDLSATSSWSIGANGRKDVAVMGSWILNIQ
jgi:hypothetical protein